MVEVERPEYSGSSLTNALHSFGGDQYNDTQAVEEEWGTGIQDWETVREDNPRHI